MSRSGPDLQGSSARADVSRLGAGGARPERSSCGCLGLRLGGSEAALARGGRSGSNRGGRQTALPAAPPARVAVKLGGTWSLGRQPTSRKGGHADGLMR
jgi:hypothetical protein